MVIYHLLITLLLLGLTLNFLLNLICFRRLRLGSTGLAGSGEGELVSVLIPARNEEKRIGPCLESLMGQSHVEMEILVLDDHSTDGTGRLVEDLARRDARIRICQGEPLPEGWTGKGWACQQLGKKARGQWLLFTDADTVHEPGGVAAVLREARSRRAALVSLWPRQLALTWSELLVIPFVHVLLLFFCRTGCRDVFVVWVRPMGSFYFLIVRLMRQSRVMPP
ncbi:MAG: glycosyltransferase [Blastochloris sp.]|nr:glycosyltransferase [Blastochloris sp.]